MLYQTIPIFFVIQIPPEISFDDIAPFAANLITAVHGLYGPYVPSLKKGGADLTPFWREGGKTKYVGQSIVVLGGASANGQYGTLTFQIMLLI